MKTFDKYWFLRYQKPLLTFANTLPGRYFLGITGEKSDVGDNKIIGILPNAIFWQVGSKQFKAEIRTHDKFSKRLYYSFKPFWHLLHEFDMTIANPLIPSWNLGFDSTGDLFSGAGDGRVFKSNGTYSTAHDAASGDGVDYTGTSTFIQHGFAAGTTYQISRDFFPFDTSVIGSGKTIDAGTFSLYLVSKDTNFDDAVRVVSSTRPSTTEIVTGDYSKLGTANGGESGAISGLSTGAYFNITLTATGLALVNATGTTDLGCRMQDDATNNAPTNQCFVEVSTSENTGTSQDPKLVITYSVAVAASGETGYSFFM